MLSIAIDQYELKITLIEEQYCLKFYKGQIRKKY